MLQEQMVPKSQCLATQRLSSHYTSCSLQVSIAWLNCFYPGTQDDGTASIWNTANLRVEEKKKWQAISESKSNCLETTHATSAYISWARGNLMDWPGISGIGKYNLPL